MAKKFKVPVQFKGFSANHEKQKASIGVSFDYDGDLSTMDASFTAAVLDVELVVEPGEQADIEGQTVMPGLEHAVRVVGPCDCAGFTRRQGSIGVTLAFSMEKIDANELLKLSGRAGMLHGKRVGMMGKDDG